MVSDLTSDLNRTSSQRRPHVHLMGTSAVSHREREKKTQKATGVFDGASLDPTSVPGAAKVLVPASSRNA